MEKQPNSRMCFVCGIDNPIGLHLKFYTDDEGRCIAHFRPKSEHQGYPGHLHGGIISTSLGEAMGLARVELIIPGWAFSSCCGGERMASGLRRARSSSWPTGSPRVVRS